MKIRAKELQTKDRFEHFEVAYIVTNKTEDGIYYTALSGNTKSRGLNRFGIHSQQFVNKKTA